MDAVLSLSDLAIGYGDRPILEHIDLDVQRNARSASKYP